MSILPMRPQGKNVQYKAMKWGDTQISVAICRLSILKVSVCSYKYDF